jgi:uncharacterized membrane protein
MSTSEYIIIIGFILSSVFYTTLEIEYMTQLYQHYNKTTETILKWGIYVGLLMITFGVLYSTSSFLYRVFI